MATRIAKKQSCKNRAQTADDNKAEEIRAFLTHKLTTSKRRIQALNALLETSDLKNIELYTNIITKHFYAIPPSQTLACIYLIGSICKSIDMRYATYLQPHICDMLQIAYSNINHTDRGKLKAELRMWIQDKVFDALENVQCWMTLFDENSNLQPTRNHKRRRRQQRRKRSRVQVDQKNLNPTKRRKLNGHRKNEKEDLQDTEDKGEEDEDKEGEDEEDKEELEVVSATKSIRCPLALCVMKEPLKSETCGHTFDRHAIFGYIANAQQKEGGMDMVECPMPGCRHSISTVSLAVDMEMKRLIDDHTKSKNGELNKIECSMKPAILELSSSGSEEEDDAFWCVEINTDEEEEYSDIEILW